MKTCLIYNYAQHYRTNIFTLMDQNMNIDFYFGDKYLNVQKMDYSLLSNKVTEVRNKWLGSIGWQTGVVKLVFKNYNTYIMLGEPMVLSTWLVLLLGRLMGKNIYFWTHGWYGKETKVKAIIKKIFFGLANGCLLYGNYARELMIKEGFNPQKLSVIHNSLLYDKQIRIRECLQKTDIFINYFKNNNPIVVFIGRLTAIKKLDQLLLAQELCAKRGFFFNVAFIGDGQIKTNLESLANTLGTIKNVWFYGPSYNEEELSNILYNADLCVAPGNIGLTAMHAMVYGCPCISHNDFKWQMPEFEAIKDGVTGTFFERDNINSLADSIENWLKNFDRNKVRLSCFKEIDEEWNPHKQLDIIKKAINDV